MSEEIPNERDLLYLAAIRAAACTVVKCLQTDDPIDPEKVFDDMISEFIEGPEVIPESIPE